MIENSSNCCWLYWFLGLTQERWQEECRLADISKKVMLREIGYKGTYAASNVLYTGQYELDRVKQTTTTAELGCSEFVGLSRPKVTNTHDPPTTCTDRLKFAFKECCNCLHQKHLS